MAIQFFSHTFLIISVITVCVYGDIQKIQVSETGVDAYSCISQEHSCKTLAYVWSQMSDGDFYSEDISKTVIHVMYNQTVQKLLKFTTPAHRVKIDTLIDIVGFNNAFINLYSGSSIQISLGTTDYSIALEWSWKGLGFALVDQPSDQQFGIDNEIPFINMSGIYYLGVDNCTFVSVSLYTEFLNTIFIINNVFGNSILCPRIRFSKVSQDYFPNDIPFPAWPIQIEGNTFKNCLHNPFNSILNIDNSVRNRSIRIVKNRFSNINYNNTCAYPTYASAISINGAPAGIFIQENLFIGNTISFITIDVSIFYGALSDTPCTWCVMQDNAFLSNHFPKASGRQRPTLVIINARVNNSECYSNDLVMPFQISINQNLFENNTKTRLLRTEVGSKDSTMYNMISLTRLSLLNNKGASGLLIVKSNEPFHENIWLNMTSLRVENNTGRYEKDISGSLETTILYIKNTRQSIINDLNFRQNLGTSLVFENEQVYGDLCAKGISNFDANTGINGGAMSLYRVAFNSSCVSIISFKKNYAVYGGALYLKNSQNLCVCPGKCSTNLDFYDNRATTSGNAVYFDSSTDFDSNCETFNMKEVGSAANSISPDDYVLSIFPGQNIIVNISIIDQFDQPSLCTASAFILCDNQIYKCFDQNIKLSGPDSVVLVQPPNTNLSILDTNLMLQSPNQTNSQNVVLYLSCQNSNASIGITLNISSCPQGFSYNSKLNVCQCAINTKHTLHVCSTVLGAVCVSHGYWYGQVRNEYIVARCKYSECTMNSAPCPPGMQNGNNYFLLSGTQCSSGRGGILCRVCAEHFVFSFLSIYCIPQEKCSSLKAVVILFFAILFQILITIFLVLVVRFKHHLGCGFLYGPMLFLAVVNHIPLDEYSVYSTLSTVVSIITSVALLNLELFGRIPWCFFESIPKLYNYSLRVLGPLTVLLVLLGITALARWHPKCSLIEKIRLRVLPRSVLQRWNASHLRATYLQLSPLSLLQSWLASPLKAMCVLMMLSFWSLADISINILTPSVLETNNTSIYMVSIQPDIAFFSPQHLPLAIPALLVLLVVILPLVIILLSAPFLQHVISLFKIKPYLDEFQSCYKDKYRWYSGVYFVVWIAIVGIQGLPDSLLYTQTIFFLLLCAQFLIKPYKSKLLNIADTLLLIDLNFFIALLYKNIDKPLSSHVFSSLLVHALIIVPFLCAILSFICLLLIKCGVYDNIKGIWNRKKRGQELQQPQDVFELSHPEVPVQEVRVSGITEREPLIAIVDNQ